MTDFPIDIVIFNKIVEVFNQTRHYVLLLFPLAFFIRIAFGFLLLKSDGFTDILKDSLFLFLGLFFFADILKMTLQIPYFISSELSFGDWRNINLGDGIFTKALKRGCGLDRDTFLLDKFWALCGDNFYTWIFCRLYSFFWDNV